MENTPYHSPDVVKLVRPVQERAEPVTEETVGETVVHVIPPAPPPPPILPPVPEEREIPEEEVIIFQPLG